MSTSIDQVHRPREADPGGPGPIRPWRSVLNWFGAAFGIAVLIGAAYLYLTARVDQGGGATTTVADTSPVVTTPAEPPEPPDVAPQVEDDPMADPTARALLALYVVDSLEFHQLEETYAAATQVDEGHVAQMASALAALDTVEWPAELSEVAAGLRTQMEEVVEAMAGQDVEETRHAIEAVHEGQHLLASGIYAWLAGVPMMTHEEAEAPVSDEDGEAAPVEPAGPPIIEIGMYEFGYDPPTIDIPAGTPVIFRLTNDGKLPHEAMVGDEHMQEEWAAAGEHDGGQEGEEGHHGDLMATLVQPGETRDLEVLIDEPGTWYMACHLIGHYEQGQVTTINVTG